MIQPLLCERNGEMEMECAPAKRNLLFQLCANTGFEQAVFYITPGSHIAGPVEFDDITLLDWVATHKVDPVQLVIEAVMLS